MCGTVVSQEQDVSLLTLQLLDPFFEATFEEIPGHSGKGNGIVC